MKVTIELELTDCSSCPFFHKHYGHGEYWYECSHKSHGREPYENILYGGYGDPKPIPEWCPLRVEQ